MDIGCLTNFGAILVAAGVGAAKTQRVVGFKSRRIGRREAVEHSVVWDGRFIQLVKPPA